jgi:SAM-dependent methyltransferase
MFLDRYRSCPLCDSHAIGLELRRSFHGVEVHFERCASCNLFFQNPRLSNEAIRELYRTTNYFDGGAYSDYVKLDPIRIAHSHKRIDLIERVSGIRNGRLLDIGSANGFFGVAALERGYAVTCVEPDANMAAFGRTHYGLDFRISIFEEAELDPPYDVITLWGTDSHFLHPLRSFERLASLLRPGGIFVMNYQRFDHWLRWIFPKIKIDWNVMYNWTDQSFDFMLGRVGLNLLDRRMEWQQTTIDHIARAIHSRVQSSIRRLTVKVPTVSYCMIVARRLKAVQLVTDTGQTNLL